MKFFVFLLLFSITAYAATLEDCQKQFAAFKAEKEKSGRRLRYAIGASVAAHGAVIGYSISDAKKNAALAESKEKSKTKDPKEEKIALKSKAELVAEARENLKNWQERNRLKTPLSEFLIQTEMERQPEKLQLLRYGELEKFRAAVAEDAKKINGAGADQFIESLQQNLFAKYGSIYCQEFGRYTDYVENGCGNCSSRNKLVISGLLDSGIKIPAPYKLAIQNYSNHIQPVLYNPKTKEVIVLIGGEKQATPNADLYEPTFIHCGYLRGVNEDKEDCQKATLIAKAENPIKASKKDAEFTTNDKMNFGESASTYPGGGDRDRSISSLSMGGLAARSVYADFKTECGQKNQKNPYSDSKFSLSSTYWSDKDEMMVMREWSKGSYVTVYGDNALCEKLKAMKPGERLQALIVQVNDELNEIFTDALINQTDLAVEKLKRDPKNLPELAKLQRKLDAVEQLSIYGGFMRKLAGVPDRPPNPKVKYLKQLRKTLLESVEENAIRWLIYFSEEDNVEARYEKAKDSVNALEIRSLADALYLYDDGLAGAIREKFLDPRITQLASKSPEKTGKKEDHPQNKADPNQEYYNPNGKRITFTIKLAPLDPQKATPRKIANENLDMPARPIEFDRKVFKAILNEVRKSDELFFGRLDRNFFTALQADPEFWRSTQGLSDYNFLTPDYLAFIQKPENQKRLGFTRMVYLRISYEGDAKYVSVAPGKYGPIPYELARFLGDEYERENKYNATKVHFSITDQ